jgi:hypothetical protein
MAQSAEMQITDGDGSNADGTRAQAPIIHHAAASKAKAMPKAESKRKPRPRIDLDDAIAAAQSSYKQAAKCMAKARAEARNEKRKKARLFKKASQLSAGDLERIAILKRSGLWDPNLQGIAEAEDVKDMVQEASHTGGSSGSGLRRAADDAEDQSPAAKARRLQTASNVEIAAAQPEANEIDDNES